MQPMLSIDFGNTYTKVALRPNADSATTLLSDKSLKWDDLLQACVPTLVARYEHDGKTDWYYGTDVVRFREESTPGLTVYRNWKPRFFETTPATIPMPVAVGNGARLPAPRGMSEVAWRRIVSAVPADEAGRIWAEQNRSVGEETDLDHKEIGLGFFRWLRGFVDPLCRARVGIEAARIPVRVSLPSFGSVAHAEELLQEMLVEAGWRPDDRVPTLPEPLANAIGTFTEGVNHVRADRKSPDYGKMFRHTGLLARMRGAILEGDPTTAWVLIADVGGYTTDFAMLGLDLTDIDARLFGQIDGRPRLAHHSEPIGVTDLDARVRAVLSEAKQAAVDDVITDPNSQRLEAFHRNIYGHATQAALRKGRIGSSAAEKTLIRSAIARFAEDVADDAEAFLEIHQYDRIDDLILTGGGTMIPAVRNSLCKRLSSYGVQKAHFHQTEQENSPIPVARSHSLEQRFVRGATAVGGASVYFDFADV